MKAEYSNYFLEDSRVCVMRGFYDEKGEYCEEYRDNIELHTLPGRAAEKVSFRYDITTLYSKSDVLVVAKSLKDIYEYRMLGANQRFFHSLLHTMESNSRDGYMCIVTNLEALKKSQERKRLKNCSFMSC